MISLTTRGHKASAVLYISGTDFTPENELGQSGLSQSEVGEEGRWGDGAMGRIQAQNAYQANTMLPRDHRIKTKRLDFFSLA